MLLTIKRIYQVILSLQILAWLCFTLPCILKGDGNVWYANSLLLTNLMLYLSSYARKTPCHDKKAKSEFKF
jgi:hypothetical protein